MRQRVAILLLFCCAASFSALAQTTPAPVEGDHVIRDFRFESGETLPELRLHYRTLGQPVKDAAGQVRNAILVMHGTTGSGSGFLSPSFGAAA